METKPIDQLEKSSHGLIEQVAKTNQGLIITKDGKPLAQIIPCNSTGTKAIPGQLAHTLIYEGDIVSPLGEEMWNACK